MAQVEWIIDSFPRQTRLLANIAFIFLADKVFLIKILNQLYVLKWISAILHKILIDEAIFCSPLVS